MGKTTGFMDYTRKTSTDVPPLERMENFDEFHIWLSREEQQTQAARCMDCGVPFCQAGMMIGGMASGCPLNNLIPEWNDLVYHGKWELALHRLLATNRFPEFTSRVCPALCEAACTCGDVTGSSVTVRENEHAIIETGYAKGWLHAAPPPARTGKSVAVVGSGPSGLSVAEYLNKRGHAVTVFERADRVGGLLMYGIPNMKLDKSVIERRIKLMQAEGVEFRTNMDVGGILAAEELLSSYDAVVLCCGAKQARDLNVPGRDANGVHFAVDYLTSVTRSLLDSKFADGKAIDAKGKNVLVIGGGDTGNDCQGTALRQGCTDLVALEMMPQPPKERAASNPWPEWPRVLKVPEHEIRATLIKVDNAYESLAKLLNLYEMSKPKKQGIDSLAYIAPSAKIGENVYIGAFAYIGENAVIGDNTQIYPHTFVGDGVKIGNGCLLYSNVNVYHDCRIGNECILHSGAVIGADGFGFAPTPNGYDKIPQIGIVILEDKVDIGANTCVDRATMGATIIHSGAKIDNLVQIAHNDEIGSHTVMAAQVGIAGSAKIGEWCMFGGQVGIAGHITIGDRVNLGAQSGIPSSIKADSVLIGTPPMEPKAYFKAAVVTKNLPDMQKEIRNLRKEVEELKQLLNK